ncbi:MAG TPA: ATP-binding cassette domain-containing protein [Panacibacter sp.]|nr:ATP-binding cassette domain-containing protein [Panacibacter sp.]
MIAFTLHKKLHAADGIIQMNFSYTVEAGQLVSIYGSSGAGKTSILRMLAGFFNPDAGTIVFNDEIWFDAGKKINVPPQKRSVGFVFQDYALFPNMSVKENLEFALQKGGPKNIIDELMNVTELEQLHNRRVQTLSGGQKQRVALARALVRKPKLLLLDEPLSAIDNELRTKLQDILINIHRSYNLTTVLVSHDVAEIIKLSDKTILLENGLIKKSGEPATMFFPQTSNENFSLEGNIIKIENSGNFYTVTVLAGNQIINVKMAESEIKALSKGDKIMLSSKVFEPEIQKIDSTLN